VGTSSAFTNEKSAKDADFYDLPDNLSDTEEQTQGQQQRAGILYRANNPEVLVECIARVDSTIF